MSNCWKSHAAAHYYLGLVARKPVFGVSDKASFKPVFSTTRCKFTYNTFQKANNKGADQTARMRKLVCACVVRKPPKTGFLTLWPISKVLLWSKGLIILTMLLFTDRSIMKWVQGRKIYKGPRDCPECGLRCRSLAVFNLHFQRHTGEKPFVCVFCGNRFRRKYNLNVHLKRKHIDRF